MIYLLRVTIFIIVSINLISSGNSTLGDLQKPPTPDIASPFYANIALLKELDPKDVKPWLEGEFDSLVSKLNGIPSIGCNVSLNEDENEVRIPEQGISIMGSEAEGKTNKIINRWSRLIELYNSSCSKSKSFDIRKIALVSNDDEKQRIAEAYITKLSNNPEFMFQHYEYHRKIEVLGQNFKRLKNFENAAIEYRQIEFGKVSIKLFCKSKIKRPINVCLPPTKYCEERFRNTLASLYELLKDQIPPSPDCNLFINKQTYSLLPKITFNDTNEEASWHDDLRHNRFMINEYLYHYVGSDDKWGRDLWDLQCEGKDRFHHTVYAHGENEGKRVDFIALKNKAIQSCEAPIIAKLWGSLEFMMSGATTTENASKIIKSR